MEIKKILFPTDFSSKTESSLIYLIKIAEKLNADIVLYHVYKLPNAGTEIPYTLLEEQVDEITENSLKSLKKISEGIKTKKPHLKVDCFTKSGTFANEVKKIVKAKEIDLIVMGTKGPGLLSSQVFSTNSAKIINEVTCPVLVVPKETEYRPFLNIVYASEYLDSDVEAIRILAQIAEVFDAEITVLNVFEDKTVTERIITKEFEAMIHESISYSKIKFTYIKGQDVCSSIDHYLESCPTDLFGMSTSHRSFIEKIVHPSKTQKMLYKVHKPLIAFHS